MVCGPKDEVNVGRPLQDSIALLTGDETTHTDDQLGALLLQLMPPTQLRKHFFLRLLAYRTGIEQQHVGMQRVGDDFKPVRPGENIRHLARVILVHLTTMRLNEKLAAHFLPAKKGGQATRYFPFEKREEPCISGGDPCKEQEINSPLRSGR